MYDSNLKTKHENAQQDIDEATRANTFCIFTSFRLDAPIDRAETTAKLCHQDPPFPFSLHQERLVHSAEAFGWSEAADWLSGPQGLQRLADAVGSEASRKATSASSAATFKVRLTVSRDAVIRVECSQLETGNSNQADAGIHLPEELAVRWMAPGNCRIVLDTEPTQPSLFTAHKTTARIAYENARKRANISKATADHGEVLLFNPNSEIMEASISTPYFYRSGQWVTPPLSSGGNAGVTRRVALENGLCVEEIVEVDSLKDKETVWISNGVRGFIMGTLHLHN
jgi:4-amino-4-deoxychorismate lyase